MKHNLEHIKNDYQNIPVPKNLKAQVKSSIAQAKADLEQESACTNAEKKRFFSLPLRIAAGAVAAVFALTVLVNSNASIAQAMEKIPLLGTIVKIVTFREYTHQENEMEANIKIPKVQVEDKDGNVLEDTTKKLNDDIQSYTDEIIKAYQADVKAAGEEGKEAVDLEYEIVTDNEKLFSLRFLQTVTMASSAQSVKIYHVDKSTGQLITLKDLFSEGADYKTPISENIKEQMRTQMKEDDTKSYWVDSDVPEWNFQEISDTASFYINKEGKLVILFDEYEAAPGYMGIVSFEIPTEVISSIVKDGYLQTP